LTLSADCRDVLIWLNLFCYLNLCCVPVSRLSNQSTHLIPFRSFIHVSNMKLAFALAFAALAAAAPGRRDTCNADNVLRALRNAKNSASASLFCATYIQSTATVTASTTNTLTAGATVTPPDVTTSVTSTTTQIFTTTLTDDFYSANPTVSVVVSSTVTTIETTTYLDKRSLAPGEPTELATYPPSRISSACSCFVPPPAPTTVTVTTTFSATTTKTVGVLGSFCQRFPVFSFPLF
jgi:hypothetical protein